MDEPFFPNQPPVVLEQELRIRGAAATMPEPACLDIYSALSRLVPSFTDTDFAIEADMVMVRQGAARLAFPRPVPMVKMSHIVCGYDQWLERKYCLPGFVAVEAGDVVVDCGAYVGGFARSAARAGATVHAFEPEEKNGACTKLNLAEFIAATVNVCGLYDHSGEMTLNISASSVEHSLLTPDDGSVLEARQISVISLADYANANGIPRYDFVKIEAEGVELEVFAGLADLRPGKFAIDVSPERDGESPAEEFRALLEARGYEVRQRGHVMFARRDGAADGSEPREAIRAGVPPSDAPPTRSPAIPRVIYSLWLDGLESAPPMVRLNLARWAELNPSYRVEVLDRSAVATLLQDFPNGFERLTVQALSDVVRVRLLRDTGGIWVDASVFPTAPLDAWLAATITESGFFAFERPGPDRPISSWFLAASAGNKMMEKWSEAVDRFWPSERSLVGGIPDDPVAAVETWPDRFPYFWFHYLFQALVDRDPDFATAWASCRKRSAQPPHALQAAFAKDGGWELNEAIGLAAAAPVHKLDWRIAYPVEMLAELSPQD